mmetsp:Transcript_14222/g.18561  ORF Transcript_14222/g.18561 Transcript_14222/m.18561 type:complete len:81 (+) Transcript_14222:493-735(+)
MIEKGEGMIILIFIWEFVAVHSTFMDMLWYQKYECANYWSLKILLNCSYNNNKSRPFSCYWPILLKSDESPGRFKPGEKD